MGGLCQRRPAVCRAFIYMVEGNIKTGQAGGLPYKLQRT